jgi:hypothetical protein
MHNMKKFITFLVVAGVIVGFFSLRTRKVEAPVPPQSTSSSTNSATNKLSSSAPSESNPSALNPPALNGAGDEPGSSEQEPIVIDAEEADQVKPAGEAYASADEAMQAVLTGSKDYNDAILEQFTLPGPECSWCPQFYEGAREKATNPNTPQEQRAYLSEILAISGRLENIQTLSESIKTARSNEEADLYAEALELSLGNEDIVKFLGDQMTTPNDTLREASVAAVTNQGTPQSVELLSKHVKERGDPDGYYSSGIGPAELIPEEDALPLVQEQIHDRNDYSHLWVKSALNAGMPGLRIVFAELENSQNPEADRELLKNAMDHVNLEDGLQSYAEEIIVRNKSVIAVEFATKIKDEFNQQEDEAPDLDS